MTIKVTVLNDIITVFKERHKNYITVMPRLTSDPANEFFG